MALGHNIAAANSADCDKEAHGVEQRRGRSRAFPRLGETRMTFIIQKFADEGSSEPYYARLWIGIFELRDQVTQLPDGDEIKSKFDEGYRAVLEAIDACRGASKKILASVQEHRARLRDANSIKHQPPAIEVPESVQNILSENIRSFLVNGVIAIKHCQDVHSLFGVDIHCLFAKQLNFEKGIENLKTVGHAKLADFLIETRNKWSEPLKIRRNELEHAGWTLQDCSYNITANRAVELIEPEVDGEPISAYVQRMLNRIISFVENSIVYSIQSFLPNFIIIVEIPNSERDPDRPLRFRGSLRGTNEREWEIVYSEIDFP
jgi:hypothetical protein